METLATSETDIPLRYPSMPVTPLHCAHRWIIMRPCLQVPCQKGASPDLHPGPILHIQPLEHPPPKSASKLADFVLILTKVVLWILCPSMIIRKNVVDVPRPKQVQQTGEGPFTPGFECMFKARFLCRLVTSPCLARTHVLPSLLFVPAKDMLPQTCESNGAFDQSTSKH